MKLRREVLELLMAADEWNLHGGRVQALAVVEVDAAWRSPCLDTFECQVYTAWLGLDLGGSDIADDFGDE